MEKKQQRTCPLNACEKMFRAIASTSPFHRRISHHHHQDSSKSAAVAVPVSFINDSQKRKRQGLQNNNIASKLQPLHRTKPESDLSLDNRVFIKGGNIPDETFTTFMEQAGSRIRKTSSLSSSASANISTANNKGDHFSDYIDRARHRMMKTMSSFGGGRSHSIK